MYAHTSPACISSEAKQSVPDDRLAPRCLFTLYSEVQSSKFRREPPPPLQAKDVGIYQCVGPRDIFDCWLNPPGLCLYSNCAVFRG